MKKFLAATLLAIISSTAFAAHELNLPPNELGKVMVLMYHQIVEKENTWARTPENFQKDLDALYVRGYYLVNLKDMIDGNLHVPKGKTPVVLTFDDTAQGQIEKLDDSGRGIARRKNTKFNGNWDPRSAVGMINAMYEKHPDFGRAGVFYLNKKSEALQDGSIGPDSRPGLQAMLQEMVKLGYELGNHTVSHPQLKTLDQTGVENELGGLQEWVHKMVPGYKIKTMALPHGIHAKEDSWTFDGVSKNNVRYVNEGIVEVGSSPASSPYSKSFRNHRIPRVRGSETLDKGDALKKITSPYLYGALAIFDSNPSSRFISDGQADVVTVPASRSSDLRTDLSKSLKIILR